MKLKDIYDAVIVESSRSFGEVMTVNKVSSREFAKIAAAAYDDLPTSDANAKQHWSALNRSNYTLWRRMLSKVDVVFTTETGKDSTIKIAGREHKVINHPDPYDTAEQMKQDVADNGIIKISMDYSDHPVFSIEDNIVFRGVHDYIVHILAKKPFGLYGELQAYNVHSKLTVVNARPALFTEVVGQVCWHFVNGKFPVQKVAVMEGFDYVKVGSVEQSVIDKYKQ